METSTGLGVKKKTVHSHCNYRLHQECECGMSGDDHEFVEDQWNYYKQLVRGGDVPDIGLISDLEMLLIIQKYCDETPDDEDNGNEVESDDSFYDYEHHHGYDSDMENNDDVEEYEWISAANSNNVQWQEINVHTGYPGVLDHDEVEIDSTSGDIVDLQAGSKTLSVEAMIATLRTPLPISFTPHLWWTFLWAGIIMKAQMCDTKEKVLHNETTSMTVVHHRYRKINKMQMRGRGFEIRVLYGRRKYYMWYASNVDRGEIMTCMRDRYIHSVNVCASLKDRRRLIIAKMKNGEYVKQKVVKHEYAESESPNKSTDLRAQDVVQPQCAQE